MGTAEQRNESTEAVGAVSMSPSTSLLDLFRRLLDLRLCIGTRCKCDDGHEWVSAHGDCIWFQMPTCPTCHKPAAAQRGEWQTLREWSNAGSHQQKETTQ